MGTRGDETTIRTLMDIAGSCVVDIFYNHLHDRAIAMHEKSGKSVTTCYREAIAAYVGESREPQFYTMLLNSIHHYTKMSTVYNTIAYSDCVTLYSSLFVPQIYMPSLTFEQRVNVLSMALGGAVRAFADEILQSHISIIIDDHADCFNIEFLQDEMLKCMLKERSRSYDIFLQSQKTTKSTKEPTAKAASTKPTVTAPSKAMRSLSEAFKKSIAEKSALKKKNAQLAKQFGELKQMLLSQLEIHKQQKLLIQQLKSQLDTEPDMPTVESGSATENRSPAGSDYDNDELFSIQYVEEERA